MANPNHVPSLTRRIAVGATWLVAGRWTIRLIGLMSTLVLARLLTPADFGIVALANLVIAVLDTMTDLRFGHALVRYQDVTQDEYNTAWTLNLFRGFALALLLAGGAPLFAGIFHEPRLTAVFLVLSLIALMEGFQNIGTVQFVKDIRFDRDFWLRIGPKLSTFIVTVTCAFLWRSYWALVAGIVAGNAGRLVLSYVVHPFRPRLSFSSWHRLFAFSSWLMAGQVVSLINQRLEQLLIGGFFSTTLVGIYNVAYEVAAMATAEFVGPMSQALFPGFSQISHDKPRLQDAYEKSVQFVVALGTPLGVGLALVAPEFVVLVLGPKWIDAVPPLRILSIMCSASIPAMASSMLLPALGRTREMFLIDITQFFVRLPGTALVIWQFGFAGAAWVRLVFGLWWTLQYVWVVRKVLELPFHRLFVATWRSYAATAIMVLVVISADGLLPSYSGTTVKYAPVAALWLILVFKAAVGAATYVVAHLVFWRLQGQMDGPERTIILALKPRLRFLS